MVKNLNSDRMISFIIPAYNEEEDLRTTITSIKDMPSTYAWEIIVVDNGSTDRTAEIAKGEDVTLISQERRTIASARNRGVSVSHGEIIVFLDADISVTDQWFKKIVPVMESLLNNPMVVTGSRCGVEDDPSWISRFWFERMKNESANYINSGHMITSRKLFDALDGFNEHMETAEDHDFCVRAKGAGADIINNPELKVIHRGYPRTVGKFIARERWHGKEDFKSLKSIVNSKIALIVLANSLLFVSLFFLAIIHWSLSYIIFYAVTISLISIMSTLLKFGYGSPVLLLNSSLIFMLYYLGRSLSMVDRVCSESISGSN